MNPGTDGHLPAGALDDRRLDRGTHPWLHSQRVVGPFDPIEFVQDDSMPRFIYGVPGAVQDDGSFDYYSEFREIDSIWHGDYPSD